MDPAELMRQRKARINTAAGSTEHPADVEAYIRRTKAGTQRIPTPGVQPEPEPVAEPVAEAAPAAPAQKQRSRK
jgi:hypothetical protein